MRLETEALDYQLPPERLALTPCQSRDHARLMVTHKSTGEVEHAHVADLPHFLKQDDLIILNETTVIPARFHGDRVDSGGHIEGLWIEALKEPNGQQGGQWRVMIKSNGKLRPGLKLAINDRHGCQDAHTLVLDEFDKNTWIVHPEPALDAKAFLEQVGLAPLPPYILAARRRQGIAGLDREDQDAYQTVYANPQCTGSIAAPTAGLHFTPQVIKSMTEKGVDLAYVNLTVGPGTFKTVECSYIDDHVVDPETFSVPKQTIEQLSQDRSGRRIAVGTTTVRTLESLAYPLPHQALAIHGQASLVITPGHTFQFIDALMTNFHLPSSSLLALAAAFAGLEQIKHWYEIAIAEEYRFYSYGDAMLILP
ncbi:MAG: tRNA preQ1(34) S-adenosylmethionine ribosyltransferase-isomerase QueA [Phycisphaerales bacterium]|nr:tRNA preQ1(34) S-adenosylmethionine ribosyltransferase-isomerase QueA [Phycisphaerales bacterium]